MAIERVFVAGAGLMGHGIAQVCAAAGKQVTVYEPDLSRAASGCDRIAGNLDRMAKPDAVFGSNTSSISIDRLAAAVGEGRRPRFVGVHFFSPVPVMPL